jgi:hypothetical protein
VLVFKFVAEDFVELPALDLQFSDSPQRMRWCGRALALVVKDEFVLVEVFREKGRERPGEVGRPWQLRDRGFQSATLSSGEMRVLFPIGSRSLDPLIVDLPDRNSIAFVVDDVALITDHTGVKSKDCPAIRFSDCPIAIGKSKRMLRNRELQPMIPRICSRFSPRNSIPSRSAPSARRCSCK